LVRVGSGTSSLVPAALLATLAAFLLNPLLGAECLFVCLGAVFATSLLGQGLFDQVCAFSKFKMKLRKRKHFGQRGPGKSG
jgi:hypothetical protein